MLERLFGLLLPPHIQDDDATLRVTRFIALVTLASTIFSFITTPLLYWYFDNVVIAVALATSSVLHLGGLMALRYLRDYRVASAIHIWIQLCFIFALIMVYFTERSVFYLWLPYIVILATFSLGRRAGAVLVGALTAIIWQLELWYNRDQLWPTQTLDNPYAAAISLTLTLFMTGIVAWLFEMTHRYAEQRLFTSEQKLRLHVEQTPLAVLTCSLEGLITEWNLAAERMFGYTRQEAIGKYIGEVIVPEPGQRDETGITSAFWGLLSGAEHFHQISRHLTKDGSDVYCEWFNTPLVEKNGAVVGVTSLVMDIGERMRAEEALRASEARFRRLASQSPDAIVIYDWSIERVVYTNRDMLAGIPWRDADELDAILGFIVDEDRDRIHLSWRAMEHAPEGQDTNSNEFRIYNADGGIEWLRSRETVLTRDATGKATQLLATITIITDEKRYEDELRRAKDEAERMARARSQFLANMSHEIRTPMNGIIGMTSLLMDAELKDEQRDFLETIRGSSEALLTIINEILDFSKIESGAMELETQPFDIRDCIEGALDLLAIQAAAKGLELGYRFDPALPHRVVGDVTRLRQILVNLLGNAIKFTERGEVWLEVTLMERDEQTNLVRWSVHDTGIGIPPEKMPLLFKPFTQVDASSTRRYGGTGLGLVISRRLTDLMGGSMWAESEFGQGCTFTFTLPMTGVDGEPAQPPAVLAGKRLLALDANNRSRRLLCDLAAQWGMEATALAATDAALAQIDGTAAWDVVVVSDNLADHGALDVVHAACRHAGLPVFLLASLANPNARAYAEESCVNALLYKPLKPRDLLGALTTHFGAPQPVDRTRTARTAMLDHGLGARHPLTILLAEDNVVNQKVATLILDRLGYRADLAASGHEVLHAIRRQSYDVILMDVHMPEMDGIEATELLLQRLPKTRHPYIIAMTAAAMQEDRERCAAAGMHDFISKPVQIDELVAALLRAEPWLAQRNSVSFTASSDGRVDPASSLEQDFPHGGT